MLWAFFGILIAILLLNEILFFFGHKNLSYKMNSDKQVYEIGEEITLTPIIENRKVLSVPFLNVNEYHGENFSKESSSYNLFMMPFQRVTMNTVIYGKKRGLWILDGATLRTFDLLGFHQNFMEVSVKRLLVILPLRRKLAELVLPYDSLHGFVSVKRWIVDDPLMLRGVREYTGRESERYIHWPSSLKHDRLLVKQFDFTSEKSAMVFLNLESRKPYWKEPDIEAIEESIITSRAVLEELIKEKIPAGFSTNGYNAKTDGRGVNFPPGLSPKNLEKYNMLLGKMGTMISGNLESSLKKLSRNRSSFQVVVLITPRILKEYIDPINVFSRSGKLVLITMRDELLHEISGNVEIYKGRNLLGTDYT